MSVIEHTPVIPTGTWKVDPGHSQVEFEVRYMGLTSIRGWAQVDSATLVADPGGASLEGTVATASLTTLNEQRDGHLASPDFFDVERYPEMRFASTELTADAGGRIEMTGDLTIKGVTHPVTLTGRMAGMGEDPWGNTRIGVDLEGRLDRREFGISWNAPLPAGGLLLGDSVDLNARFSFIKEG